MKGLAGLSLQPSVPGLSSLTPSEQKRVALSNARQCCGLMGGHRALTQGLSLWLWYSRKIGVPCSGCVWLSSLMLLMQMRELTSLSPQWGLLGCSRIAAPTSLSPLNFTISVTAGKIGTECVSISKQSLCFCLLPFYSFFFLKAIFFFLISC